MKKQDKLMLAFICLCYTRINNTNNEGASYTNISISVHVTVMKIAECPFKLDLV